MATVSFSCQYLQEGGFNSVNVWETSFKKIKGQIHMAVHFPAPSCVSVAQSFQGALLNMGQNSSLQMLSKEGGAGGHCLSIFGTRLLLHLRGPPHSGCHVPEMGSLLQIPQTHFCSRPPAQSPCSGEAVSVPSISSHGPHRGPRTVLHPGRGLEVSRRHSQ